MVKGSVKGAVNGMVNGATNGKLLNCGVEIGDDKCLLFFSCVFSSQAEPLMILGVNILYVLAGLLHGNIYQLQ